MSGEDSRYQLWIALVLVLGVAIQILLCVRSWIGGDQVILLSLGLDYAERGELHAMAKSMSGGGSIPGCLLQLLIGLPLKLWPDYRAPVVLIGVLHLLAAILITGTLLNAVGARFALIYLIVYWLSPWRLYHAGFSWEPAFVLLPAGAHLWASWRLRDRAAPIASAVLAVSLVFAFQIHGSFLVLVALTALLYLRRLMRVHWPGFVLGAVIGGLPLWPTARAVATGSLPELLPTKGFLGYGLVTVYPILRGFLYWFRLGSLDIGRRLQQVSFLDGAWAAGHADRMVLHSASLLLLILAMVSVILAVTASWWTFRRADPNAGDRAGWSWLRSYALLGFFALLIASALSPVAIQGWHALIALHAASLPVAAWIGTHWPGRRAWLRWAVALFLILRLPEIAILGFGHNIYQRPGAMSPEFRQLPERLRPILPTDPAGNGVRESSPRRPSPPSGV